MTQLDLFEVRGGEQSEQAGGMKRSTSAGKVDYSLALDGVMFRRYAEHLTKGAAIYEKRNWLLMLREQDPAKRAETLQRYMESAVRHLIQWYGGDRSEDHAAAVIFNLNGAETLREAFP